MADKTLRERILASNDIQSELVEVPEWGVIVEVRSMIAADRARIMEKAQADGTVGGGAVYFDTVLLTVFDPDTGERLFSESDRDALSGKNAAALDRLAMVGLRLSGMTEEAQDNAKKQFPEASGAAVPV